jgi:hypothetical protein
MKKSFALSKIVFAVATLFFVLAFPTFANSNNTEIVFVIDTNDEMKNYCMGTEDVFADVFEDVIDQLPSGSYSGIITDTITQEITEHSDTIETMHSIEIGKTMQMFWQQNTVFPPFRRTSLKTPPCMPV